MKEGEQCARLLLFRGRRCGPRPFVLVWKSRHSATPATLALGMPIPSACRRAVPLALRSLACPRFALTRPAAQLRPGPQLRPRAPQLRSGLKLSLDPARRFGPAGDMRRAVYPRPGHGNILSRCVPKLSAVAIYRPDAFTKGPRTRKKPVRGNILPACIQIQLILARYACHVSKKPRKVPLGNTPREHLAAKGRFRRPKPSNHAWRTNLAIL